MKRGEATALGFKIYYNGPCKKGHTSGRYTSNGSCTQCVKEFAEAFPEVNRKAVTEYQKRNKHLIREGLRRWRKNNRAKYLLQKYLRRNAEGSFTQTDIDNLLRTQEHKCNGCNKVFSGTLKYEVDHIIPISKGGSNWPANLQLLCRSCNARKSDKIFKT